MKLYLVVCFTALVASEYHNIHVQDYCEEMDAVVKINSSIAYGYVLDSVKHNYAPGRTCSVRMEAEPNNYHITIRFLYIDIYNSGKDNKCNDDHLSIAGENTIPIFCGTSKPVYSFYSKSNFLNFTFHTSPKSSPQYHRGFRIVYTRYHNEICDEDEYLCPFRDRCIPVELRCDNLDNCGDHSDERYCSALSAIGTIMLSACISLALLMVVILLCICVIKVLFGKKYRERRSSSGSVPISTVDQPNQNAGVTCAGIALPQAAPGTANPYNEPPPSYYYVHYTRTDEKDDPDGGMVSINPSSSSISPSCDTQGVTANDNLIHVIQSSVLSEGRGEAVNRGFVGDNRTGNDQSSVN